MTDNIRLGLVGFAKAGKDEVADILKLHCGFGKIGMSDPLNECLMVLNPVIDMLFLSEPTYGLAKMTYTQMVSTLGYTKAKEHPEVRRLLQALGTEVGRNLLDEDIWVNKMLTSAKKHSRAVITGIRYPNEAAACTHLWYISRPGFAPVNDHSSEKLASGELGELTYSNTIVNDGTLEDLAFKVTTAARSLFR